MPPRPATPSIRWPAITCPMKPSFMGVRWCEARHLGWLVEGLPGRDAAECPKPRGGNDGLQHPPARHRLQDPGGHAGRHRGSHGQGPLAQAPPRAALRTGPAFRPAVGERDRFAPLIMFRASLMAAALALVLAAPAVADEAPAGIPDLAQMAVAQTDLPSGASVASEDYYSAPGFVADYYRDFVFSRRAARRSGVVFLESDISLLENGPGAARYFAGVRQLFRNTRTGRGFARLLARVYGVPARRVRIGKRQTLPLGDAAFIVKVNVATAHEKVGMAI